MSLVKFLASLILHPGPRYSWGRVLLVVTLSSFVTTGIAYLFYGYHERLQKVSAEHPIRAIVQTGPRYGALSTSALAEIVGLSVDRPVPCNRFDLKEAQKRLLATSVIEEAKLKKIKTDVLYVDYTMRQPIAFFGDWTNTAIDEKGVFFPFAPFYSPRKLPEIYLGAQTACSFWGKQMKEEHMDVVEKLLALFKDRPIKRIDLSQIEETSSGKRQIVIILPLDNGQARILRLTPKNYVQELSNYFILEDALLKEDSMEMVIDLRINEVAYIRRI